MSQERKALLPLTLAALGVVYGDIGTSPLYAFRQALVGPHPLAPTPEHIFAILSSMFWAMTLIISIKYVWMVVNYDNEGEGGVLALTALAQRISRRAGRLSAGVVLLGVFAASLFYGDAIITPVISVLSAVEGLNVLSPELSHWVEPITIAILVGLFAIQYKGTAAVGALFGPVTTLWFLVLGALGVASVAQTPEVLMALDPRHALHFALDEPLAAFLMLSAVFLVLTGGEALYTDMGHFGKAPVRLAWYGLVCPSLVLNYFGQGALVIRDPAAAENPFFLLAPEWFLPVLIGLATLAAIIASQAVISGAFSITMQASRLGFLPRFRVLHTSDTERGQIYIPAMNWMMLVAVIVLVLEFETSSRVANAYGVAVCGAMMIDSLLCAYVVSHLARRFRLVMIAAFLLFFSLEVMFMAGNLTKFVNGAWVPVLMALAFFTLLTTWKRGSALIKERQKAFDIPLAAFLDGPLPDVQRVPGRAVYLCTNLELAPTALFHNLKHFKVMHETNVFLHIHTEEVPYVSDADRLSIRDAGHGMFLVTVSYGFRQTPDVPTALALPQAKVLDLDPMTTTFFVARSQVVEGFGGMTRARRGLFAWMTRQSEGAASTFHLPPNQVVEVGTQVML